MKRSLLVCSLALAAAACNSDTGSGPSFTSGEDPSATVFVSLDAALDLYPDALYQGRVVRDEQGCLRTEGPGQYTVVWPYGYQLVERGGKLHVQDAQGNDVGKIGGSFKFGGGEMQTIDHLPISTQKRERAVGSCPGRFWLATPQIG